LRFATAGRPPRFALRRLPRLRFTVTRCGYAVTSLRLDYHGYARHATFGCARTRHCGFYRLLICVYVVITRGCGYVYAVCYAVVTLSRGSCWFVGSARFASAVLTHVARFAFGHPLRLRLVTVGYGLRLHCYVTAVYTVLRLLHTLLPRSRLYAHARFAVITPRIFRWLHYVRSGLRLHTRSFHVHVCARLRYTYTHRTHALCRCGYTRCTRLRAPTFARAHVGSFALRCGCTHVQFRVCVLVSRGLRFTLHCTFCLFGLRTRAHAHTRLHAVGLPPHAHGCGLRRGYAAARFARLRYTVLVLQFGLRTVDSALFGFAFTARALRTVGGLHTRFRVWLRCARFRTVGYGYTRLLHTLHCGTLPTVLHVWFVTLRLRLRFATVTARVLPFSQTHLCHTTHSVWLGSAFAFRFGYGYVARLPYVTFILPVLTRFAVTLTRSAFGCWFVAFAFTVPHAFTTTLPRSLLALPFTRAFRYCVAVCRLVLVCHVDLHAFTPVTVCHATHCLVTTHAVHVCRSRTVALRSLFLLRSRGLVCAVALPRARIARRTAPGSTVATRVYAVTTC